ncbi:MAG: hypothetical protein JXB49_18750 [Bacteroidales bacterium]|nr:hypothetical protein [Bacteroidales bacterium]
MKIGFKSSFQRDIKKILDKVILLQIGETIDSIEAAKTMKNIKGLKKLKGFKSYYRIRI